MPKEVSGGRRPNHTGSSYHTGSLAKNAIQGYREGTEKIFIPGHTFISIG